MDHLIWVHPAPLSSWITSGKSWSSPRCKNCTRVWQVLASTNINRSSIFFHDIMVYYGGLLCLVYMSKSADTQGQNLIAHVRFMSVRHEEQPKHQRGRSQNCMYGTTNSKAMPMRFWAVYHLMEAWLVPRLELVLCWGGPVCQCCLMSWEIWSMMLC